MVKLVQKMPEVAQRVLSNSATFQGHPDTKEYIKYYDFLCLQDILQGIYLKNKLIADHFEVID